MADSPALSVLRKQRAALDKAIRALEEVQQLELKLAEHEPGQVITPAPANVLPWHDAENARARGEPMQVRKRGSS